MYAWPVPFLVLLTQPSFDAAYDIIIFIRLKLPSMDSIFQGSEKVLSQDSRVDPVTPTIQVV